MTIEEALAFAFGKKSGTQLDEQIVMITLAREVERLSRIDKALTEYRRKERSLLGLPDDAREEDHLDAISRLREANNNLRKHGCYPENDGQTHHATCWQTRGHHECAVRRVRELEAQVILEIATALQQAMRVEELEKVLAEVARPAYSDSDHKSLLDTLRCRAENVLKGGE